MFQNFCTTVARKLRRLGFAAQAAARFSRIFYVIMVTLFGLMGFFFCIPKELFEPITGAGKLHADARSGFFLSVAAALRH
jgi:hypothetical protein